MSRGNIVPGGGPGPPGCLYPFILPPGVSIAAAASPSLNLKGMLLGMITLLPIMLIYNAYQFSVFWGKAEEARDEN